MPQKNKWIMKIFYLDLKQELMEEENNAIFKISTPEEQ